jgi:hypothetical protein
LKTLTIVLKTVPKAPSEFLFWPYLSIVNILHCTIHFVAVFLKRFQKADFGTTLRIRCLSESRNKLLDEGHWKFLHYKIRQVDLEGSLIHAFVF